MNHPCKKIILTEGGQILTFSVKMSQATQLKLKTIIFYTKLYNNLIFIIDKITENSVTAIHMGWHDMGYHGKIILKHENQNRFQILKFHAVTKGFKQHTLNSYFCFDWNAFGAYLLTRYEFLLPIQHVYILTKAQIIMIFINESTISTNSDKMTQSKHNITESYLWQQFKFKYIDLFIILFLCFYFQFVHISWTFSSFKKITRKYPEKSDRINTNKEKYEQFISQHCRLCRSNNDIRFEPNNHPIFHLFGPSTSEKKKYLQRVELNYGRRTVTRKSIRSSVFKNSLWFCQRTLRCTRVRKCFSQLYVKTAPTHGPGTIA